MILPNRNSQLQLPDAATHLRFGLRVRAGGNADVKSVFFGHQDMERSGIVPDRQEAGCRISKRLHAEGAAG